MARKEYKSTVSSPVRRALVDAAIMGGAALALTLPLIIIRLMYAE